MRTTQQAKSSKTNLAVASETARAAGLRYVSDDAPGFTRQRVGKGFKYYNAEGGVLRDKDALARIRALAIPPAWTEVWICPHANGHLQATGRDARGRKQYRYHTKWRCERDANKYEHMLAFGKALPAIRQRTTRHLALSGLPRQKVLATVVKLLESTLIRVGNEEYARTNRSFGLTTLRDGHVNVRGANLHFRFRGKSGVAHEIDLNDQRLARIVRRCRDLPGQELFQYLDDDGEPQTITSTDVNDYLREIAGAEFTAKDFRTWAGTVQAALALQEFAECASQTEAKRNVTRAIERVAAKLGNTPSVCRKSYVHPTVLEVYMEGELLAALKRCAARQASKNTRRLDPAEAAVLALLQQRFKSTARTK
jgi:DNA topoisomerase I